jgi:carboxylesterase
MPVLEADRPYAADGGRVGIVLSHGFTGSPSSVRPWAEHLAAAGLTVRLPLLPGHGESWRETNQTRWPDWYDAIEQAFDDVSERCDVVFAGGLSMGGCLATRLAEQHPNRVAGLVLVNPAFGLRRLDVKAVPYISWALRSRAAFGNDIKKPGVIEGEPDRTPMVALASMLRLWRVTVQDLGRVRAPVLMLRSRVDHVLDSLSGELLFAGARNTTVREVMLENSYHVATLDYDAELIFERSLEFIRSLSPMDLPA